MDKIMTGESSSNTSSEISGFQKNSQVITSLVAELYEKRPYPHYPLLAKPRWQDGYLVSSMFAQSTASSAEVAAASLKGRGDSAPLPCPDSEEVLIAGSGEILPYIIRRWEPKNFNVTSVDLSKRSLRRARIRLAFNLSPKEFIQADINDYVRDCKNAGKKFRHIEAFGVFHHVWNPEHTIAGIADRIADHGTMRAMVYNGTCRNWIHRIQSVLATLGMKGDSNRDVGAAQNMVKSLANSSPFYAKKIGQMGPTILKNKTRFADTFLHPHEVRYSVEKWLEIFSNSGLEIQGVFDRFGELDDLPNPLFCAPSKEDLEARAGDSRYENNLEVFLSKRGNPSLHAEESQVKLGEVRTPAKPATRLRFMNPPAIWFSFKETESLNPIFRQMIWIYFLNHLAGKRNDLPASLKKLPLRTLQRLSRLGAIPLSNAIPQDLIESLLAPMVDAMTPPTIPALTALCDTKVQSWLKQYATANKLSVSIESLLKTLDGSN